MVSQESKKKILPLNNDIRTYKTIANLSGKCRQTVSRTIKEQLKISRGEPLKEKKKKGRKKIIQPQYEKSIKELILKYPEATLDEHCNRIKEKFKLTLSTKTLLSFFKDNDIVYDYPKKSITISSPNEEKRLSYIEENGSRD